MVTKTYKGFRDGSIVVTNSHSTYNIGKNATIVSSQISGSSMASVYEDMSATPTPNHNTFNIDGRLIGPQIGIMVQGVGDVVNIGKTGHVSGAYGVYAVGDSIRVTNAGEVTSGIGYGIYGAGANFAARNDGEVYGLIGILAGGANTKIVNGVDGEIHGVQYGVAITTSSGQHGSLVNHGTVEATYTSGLAFTGSSGLESLVNDGVMLGAVNMGDGDDSIDNRGGKIYGSIIGGSGDDVLITDHATDILSESNLGGADTVRSSVSYNLTQYVEKLVLIGKGNINGRGLDGSAETLIGNAGNNKLSGLSGADRLDGGKGTDVLAGGADADVFVFKTGNGHDTITDFALASDKVDMSAWSGMTNLAAVQAHAADHGADVLITLGGDSLLIKNIHESQLTDGDLVYSMV